MPQIVNLQRKVRLDSKSFAEFAERLLREISEAIGKNFDVAFISDRRMKELNKFFRGKDFTTDVLSFPHEPDEFSRSDAFTRETDAADGSTQITAEAVTLTDDDFLGDIVISVEQAQKQAAENGLTLEGEIRQLILHGLLHLCGYDHETDGGEMNARELELRDKLGV